MSQSPRLGSFRLLLLLSLGILGGCSGIESNGGGQRVQFAGIREVNPQAVWVPHGYKIEAVMQGLNFPTGVTFDDKGNPYVTESGYCYGEVWDTPRLLRINSNGTVAVIARGHNGPWNGVSFYQGNFYVAEGGESEGGRILQITPDGDTTALIDDLPSLGDHHTNGPVVSADGWIYFGQGTATNSGVVGLDNLNFGWLMRRRKFHDIPGQDITLAGVNFETRDPFKPPPPKTSLLGQLSPYVLVPDPPPTKSEHRSFFQKLFPYHWESKKTAAMALTGAYLPFGTPSHKGQVIHGQVPCTGAIMRIPLKGGKPELVAWGLRNPYGLAFAPDGTLYVTENQFDVRGSRPIWGTGDLLWEIHPNTWYGWPDFFAGEPLNNADRFGAPGRPAPKFLLATHPNPAPRPVAKFGVHSSADGFDLSHSEEFGHVGDAFVAEFGDMAPGVGTVGAPVGFRVSRVELNGGIVHPFAVNRGREDAPASKLGTGGFERPIAARFDPSGNALYVVDFGVMTTDDKGVHPVRNSGVLWRITKETR